MHSTRGRSELVAASVSLSGKSVLSCVDHAILQQFDIRSILPIGVRMRCCSAFSDFTGTVLLIAVVTRYVFGTLQCDIPKSCNRVMLSGCGSPRLSSR